jgi:hypothetical protein
VLYHQTKASQQVQEILQITSFSSSTGIPPLILGTPNFKTDVQQEGTYVGTNTSPATGKASQDLSEKSLLQLEKSCYC